MPESALRVRIDPQLRREFIEACRAKDQTASQVLRAYVREFVEKNHDQRQRSFFVEGRR